jgi:SAM-dependent methyltransferase
VADSGVVFILPRKGLFQQGGPDDPLPYYYRPLVSRIYAGRINLGLSLLTPPYGSLLDVGYGSGLLLPTLSKISRELVAIDRDTDSAAVYRTLAGLGVNATLVKGAVETARLPENRFDIAVVFSVFEEVPDLLPVLRSIHATLKPGGELLVGIPRVDRIMEWLFRFIGYKGIESEHIHDYRSFLNLAKTEFRFRLEKFATLPRLVPSSLALYYAMLLRKPEEH